CLVEGCRNIAHLEYESGDDAFLLAISPFWLAGEYDETRGVVLGVGDVLLEDAQLVDFCCQTCRQHAACHVAGFRNFSRRAGSVGGYDRFQPELTNDVAALAERMHMALD